MEIDLSDPKGLKMLLPMHLLTDPQDHHELSRTVAEFPEPLLPFAKGNECGRVLAEICRRYRALKSERKAVG